MQASNAPFRRSIWRLIFVSALGIITTAAFCVAILFFNPPSLNAYWASGLPFKAGVGSAKYPGAMVVHVREDLGVTEVIAWPLWWQEQSLAEVIPQDIRVEYHRWGDGIDKWSPPAWTKLSSRPQAKAPEDLPLIDNEFAIGTPWPAVHSGATTLYGSTWEALPWRPVWSGLLLDGLLYSFCWFVLLYARRWPHRFVRSRRNQCVECGYDLRGRDPEQNLCTECGASASKRS